MSTPETTMLERLEHAAPYNIFYNTIPEVPETAEQWNSITFSDFLCPSLGELKCSLQITAKVDIEWLVKQYEIRNVGTKPLTVLYHEYKPEMEEYIHDYLPNVTQHCIDISHENKYRGYHAKMGIYVYEDNTLRVVVSTANLIPLQWDHFNHGFWVSPLCHPLPETASETEGDSPTNFKSTLLNFLTDYKQPTVLNPWIDVIKRTDFTDVKVFLVTSVPGTYSAENRKSHLQQVEHLLKEHCTIPCQEQSSWMIIAQSSSLGQLGESPQGWLRRNFLSAVSSHNASKKVYQPSISLKIIYPTWKQVKNGRFDIDIVKEGLRYHRPIHATQKWVQMFLHEWKADLLKRSTIMPHTKTYCRISPFSTKNKMAWFLLTSTNMNKGGWGQDHRELKDHIYVRNYEAGVMFLPKFFDEDYFEISDGVRDKREFPLMYDMPLRRYNDRDFPWTTLKMTRLRCKFVTEHQ